MVVKANRHNPEDGGDLGGHIGSFASLAHMFGAGFNHFWHAESENHGGDCLYIQGHVSPGVYARAYLEGRLTEEQLLNFRQEVDGKGNQRLDVEGAMFKAVCTSTQRSTVDTKSLYEAFGITEEDLAKYKKPAVAVYTVKVTAR
jgi:pyruvate dehydrogenase complex dehydrogenase (E1) component